MTETAHRDLPADRLKELAKVDEDDLFLMLRKAGAKVIRAQAALDRAYDERMLLFVALEERDISYGKMARAAGGVSDVAVMRGLERWHARQPPPKRAVV